MDANPEMADLLRSTMPDLPDEPTVAQVESWIELAELARDPDFRNAVRRMAGHQAAERAGGDRTGVHHDLTDYVRDRVTEAIAAGIHPASPPAAPIVAELVDRYATTFTAADSTAYRAQVLTRLEVANDPRVERYWQLIRTINGWPSPPSLVPIFDWLIRAIQHHPQP